MKLFSFTDYKAFVRREFESRPRGGRGEYRRLADHLGTSTVAISQIFRGSRELTLEQAIEASDFLLLNPAEHDYFLLLVEHARAGSKKLRDHFEKRIQAMKIEQQSLANRVPEKAMLNEETKAIFYSNWQYSGIRITSSLPDCHGFEAIAKRLSLTVEEVAKTAHFLVQNGLCVRTGEGIQMGPSSTLLSADSPFINNHRRNWRLKGLEHLQKVTPMDLFYSGVVSLSQEDRAAFREEFVQLISNFIKRIQDSPSETVACLNIDWFEV